MINYAISFGSNTLDFESWYKFINGVGWAMSMVSNGKGDIKDGVKCAIEDK